MAKRCPTCGHSNDDSRIFCSSCGDPLDVELRLIQDLEKRKHEVGEHAEHHRYKEDDEDTYVAPIKSQQKEEKKSVLPIILVVLVVAAAAAWFFLK